jgi:hypothetical protein
VTLSDELEVLGEPVRRDGEELGICFDAVDPMVSKDEREGPVPPATRGPEAPKSNPRGAPAAHRCRRYTR